jgi:hypothetical protein
MNTAPIEAIAQLRLAVIADEFGAEYTSGDARSVAERVATAW